MLNNINIAGRLTKDPELRVTTSGVSVCSFSIAVDRDFKNSAGERETDFFEVTAWRGTADFIAQHFKKGRAIIINGRLTSEMYENPQDGIKRKFVKIVAENVYFGDSKPKDGAADAPLLGESLDFNPDELPW